MKAIAFALSIVILSLVSPSTRTAARIECVAGCGGQADGTAKRAQLIEPFGVVFDREGNSYICEYKGQRISKVDLRGMISVFAGGEDAQLKFKDPHGLVITKDQQMYVADTLNHRVIRIDLKTRRSEVVAGTGQPGYSGDGGPATAAAFNQLYAVDLSRDSDKLYMTDLANRRIRVLDIKSGIVMTIAGNGQSDVPSDGAQAIQSPLVDPRATATDSKGNVYILERRGSALRVVDRNGRIRTLSAASGMNGPKHLCVDRHDNVIIADTENHVIRKYEPGSSEAQVIAGSGAKGDQIVEDAPLKTQLNRPHGVFVHASGALFISDSENHRILKMSNW
jgi:DNA-binding beta-propeller fold protein YncE